MSDFVPRDMIAELWAEILKRHWTFLETEESIQKLEERKKLEGCLKEFLCVVPHERKFFLPETAHVLRKSIREMDDFTAYKAIIGFESISQYANNLFTKPWRKEYRVIKMYSGFFQHEIKSNLLDAEKLFEAMGYRQLSSEILVLDGPICPDQVTNVSRDAMTAYVECQILKHVYSGLAAMGLNCTWQDVFQYREKHLGGSTQTIKGIAYGIQERRFRKEKLLNSENCYATIQHVNSPQVPLATASVLPPMVQQCQNCVPYHLPQPNHAQQHLPNGQCAVHSNNNSCSLHTGVNLQHQQQPPSLMYNGNNGNSSKLIASYPAANYQQHTFVAPGTQQQHHHMSHSRSLEHYNEPPPLLPHRHSFDQQQQQGYMTAHQHQHQHHYPPAQHLYESPYDCIDGVSMGGSSASYAAVAASAGIAPNCNYSTAAAYAHPYNVSGNRYPLPYNISNQLNSHYATPVVSTGNCSGGGNGTNIDHYMDNYAAADAKHNCNYHAAQLQQLSPLPPARHNSSGGGVKDFQAYRQRSFPPDQQLIDFDDRAPLADHDFHAQLHTRSQNNSFDYERERDRCERMYEGRSADRRSAALLAGINRMNINSTYAQPKDVICQQVPPLSQHNMYGAGGVELRGSSDDVTGNYIYARPRSKGIDGSGTGGGVGGANCGERYAKEGMVSKMTDKYLRNSDYIQDYVDNNRKMHMELNERGTDRMTNGTANCRRKQLAASAAVVSADRDTSDISYESTFDDFVNVGHTEHAASVLNTQRSPTQASKNQDGVGSFESWDYVFQNLERSGYSKDLGERGDLLVQSLDLDSLNVPNANAANTTEKRRSSHAAAAEVKTTTRQVNGGEKSRTLEKTPAAATTTAAAATISGEKQREAKTTIKQEKSILKQSNSNASASASGGKIKSALKSTSTSTSAAAVNKGSNNNNNGNHQQQQQHNTALRVLESTKRQNNANQRVVKQAPVSTQVIVTSPNEWSCRFCTFLNPDTKRICEMCCRSKDFNMDVVVSNTPTCV